MSEHTDTKFRFTIANLLEQKYPQESVYIALHQCYHENPVKGAGGLTKSQCEEIIVKRLLEGNKGHYSPLEMAGLQFGLYGFNHGTIQQLTRSRIGVSFAVQSFRYTSQHIIEASEGKRDVENVIYVRPVGKYHDRESAYEYEQHTRDEDLSLARFCLQHVAKRLKSGMPPEQARGALPFDYRQHCIMYCNVRSLMGILDRRSKKDAQIEIQILANLLMKHLEDYMPLVADWYKKNRWSKAMLSP